MGAAACDDGNTCTTDICDPTKGCAFKDANGASCDPGTDCAALGVCKAKKCDPIEPGRLFVHSMDYSIFSGSMWSSGGK